MPGVMKNISELSFLPDGMIDQFTKAGEMIRSIEGPIRVISHYDADGISAAGVMSQALFRAGLSFQTSMITSLDKARIEQLKGEDNALVLFMDMGSGQLELISGLDTSVIILDHHTPQSEFNGSDATIEINCHRHGINGTVDASASTLSFLLAISLDSTNWDLVDLALAGNLGDKQHLEGLVGINSELEAEAQKQKIITSGRSLALFGRTVTEGITNSINPFFKGLTGNEAAVKEFLRELRIDPDSSINDMEPGTVQELGSVLVFRLLKQGVRPEIAETLLLKRYYSIARKMDIEDLSHIINSCGRMDKQSVGLSVCFGDPEALREAREIRAKYKTQIREGMLEIEKGEISEMKALQYFYADNPTFAGTYAGLGMQFLLDQERPLIVLTKLEKETRISGRGTLYLVKKGMDLANALHTAATKLEGNGGGHPVAAGASIPPGTEDRFLDHVNKIVGKQLKIK